MVQYVAFIFHISLLNDRKKEGGREGGREREGERERERGRDSVCTDFTTAQSNLTGSLP